MENDDNNKNEKDNESSSSVEYLKNEIPHKNDVNKSLIIRQLYDHTTRKFSSVVIGNKNDRDVFEAEESLCIHDDEYSSLNPVSSSNQSIHPPPTNTKIGKSTKAALTQSYASLKGSNSTTSSTSSKNPQSNFCNNCGLLLGTTIKKKMTILNAVPNHLHLYSEKRKKIFKINLSI